MIPTHTLIEDTVVDILEHTGPCSMDDLLAKLPSRDWTEIFSAVDGMSRDGRLVLRRTPDQGYLLSLPSVCRGDEPMHMTQVSVRFCVGCGYLCDEIQPEDVHRQWIDAHTYLMRYGITWNDLDRRDDTCPACARVFACSRRTLRTRRAEVSRSR